MVADAAVSGESRARAAGESRSSSIPYRPEIDGLRAIAVIGVIAHHANVAFVPGGFVGVDVFFVISGFLISQLLLAELAERGRIDLAAFWGRRARRILPAAGLVIVATAALSAAFLPAADLARAGGDLIASALYVVNWRFVGDATNYFADTSPSVALHYWSLSVEEQFYLVWPLLFSALFFLTGRGRATDTQRRGRLILCLLAVAAASLIYCIAITQAFQPIGFFDTSSRAWQFAVGGAAAIATRWLTDRRLRALAAWTGAAAIVAAMALFTDEMLYPGWLALVPTLGAALLLLSLGPAPGELGLTHRLLASAPMSVLGRISYALYLWHWPVLFFAPQLLPEQLGDSVVWPILLSVALAALTHYALENPVRFAGALKRRAWASLGVGGATSLAAAGGGFALVLLAGTAGLEIAPGRRVTPEMLRADVTEAYAAGCHLAAQEVRTPDCSYGPADARHAVFLFGDSHAAHWSPAVRAAVEHVGDWRLEHRTKSFCPSVDITVWRNDLNRPYTECAEWRDAVLEEIRVTEPDLVIVANSSIYLSRSASVTPSPRAVDLPTLRAGEEAFIRRLLAAAPGRVVVVTDVAKLPDGEPETCLFAPDADPQACAWERDGVRADRYPYIDYAGFERVEHLDLTDAICDGDLCPAIKNGAVVMRDPEHLSASFALTLAPKFEALLAEAQTTEGARAEASASGETSGP